MEIRIDRNELLKAVKIAIKGISKTSTLQILRGIKLEAKNEFLYLTSTDLELTINTKIACDIIAEGSCVIGEAKLFNDIITKLPDGEVSIKVSDNKATIKSKDSKFNLAIENAFDFPNLECIQDSIKFDIDNNILLEGIKKVVIAISDDGTRPVLTGSLMEIKKDSFSLVALDGYRLAYFNVKGEFKEEVKAIVPKIALNEIARLIDGVDIVNVSINDKFASFQIGDTNLTTSLIQGVFFNYNDLLKDKSKTKINLNTKELLNCLDRATLLSKDGSNNLIKIKMENKEIIITANSQIADVVEKVEILSQSGEDIVIGFNSKFIIDGLKSISDPEINIYLNGSNNPSIIKGTDSEEEYLYLVLPIRISQE